MPMKRADLDEKRIKKELQVIKRELEDIRLKLEVTERVDLDKLSPDAVKRVKEAATEVKKTAEGVATKAIKLVRSTETGTSEESGRLFDEEE